MIKTATQLKAKIRNMSGGDSNKAQTFLRNYMMERFLERCSVSKYRKNIILKGGMFVASYVGLDFRATMDIDTTIQSLSLTLEDATNVIKEIISIPMNDGITFELMSARAIMEEHEYPGLRFMIDGFLGQLRQAIKIDISTGDAITPAAIEYSYKLMFEDRNIDILAYNLETILGEKMETILTRGEANTRMRDYYDIYILLKEKKEEIHPEVLIAAFSATCKKRNTSEAVKKSMEILNLVSNSETLKRQWENYKRGSFYVGELEWSEAISAAYELAQTLKLF